MKRGNHQKALKTAVSAARAAGDLMKKNFRSPKKVSEESRFDIKLELDVRCQETIMRTLAASFPDTAVVGEEGIRGDAEAEDRWVVDPIDGTVNFTHEIPHSCVSIALQSRAAAPRGGRKKTAEEYDTLLGVVYDPFCDELWTAVKGGPAYLNGRKIQVSKRSRLAESIVSIGFSKESTGMESMLPVLGRLIRNVRKIRVMGSAALALTYVASGRFDAYLENEIRLWDIAAGGLIVECAGGEFWRKPAGQDYRYQISADNGRMRRKLDALKRRKA